MKRYICHALRRADPGERVWRGVLGSPGQLSVPGRWGNQQERGCRFWWLMHPVTKYTYFVLLKFVTGSLWCSI